MQLFLDFLHMDLEHEASEHLLFESYFNIVYQKGPSRHLGEVEAVGHVHDLSLLVVIRLAQVVL